MSQDAIVIVGAKRTAIGALLGQYTGVPTTTLGATAIKAALADRFAHLPRGNLNYAYHMDAALYVTENLHSFAVRPQESFSFRPFFTALKKFRA